MKKTLIAIPAIFLLAGCVGPMHVTSVPAYKSSIDNVVAGIESEGYKLVGNNHDTRNERRHEVAHMEGDNTYSDWIPNDMVNIDTYSFADGAGNTMNFTVQYKGGIDHTGGTFYYTDVQVVGCSTSNKQDNERLCGEHSPVWTLDTIPTDMTVNP
ncbi:MAG: hypothetical protein IKR83_03160 [Bacteroidales bacterium]|nr:hypothetical protein [Bacteroidales bacterium]